MYFKLSLFTTSFLKIGLIIGILSVFSTCQSDDDQRQYKRWGSATQLDERIERIDPGFILGNSWLYILEEVLIVLEWDPEGDKGIHLFDKNTFRYLTSTGILGQGPGEIIRFGRMGVNPSNRTFWVPDHGKQMVFVFHLDSVLRNENYLPRKGFPLNDEIFIEHFDFINDSIVLGKAVQVLSSSSFDMATARFNIKSEEIKTYGYEPPDVIGKKANSQFKSSVPNDFYVNAYYYYDLITICALDGSLLQNVLGPDGLDNKKLKKTYYTEVDILGDEIWASYLGDVGLVEDEFGQTKGALPTKWLVFNQNGGYIRSFRSDFHIRDFCMDEENNRIIAFFDDREPGLAYIDLEGLE